MKKFFLPLIFVISIISCSLNINQSTTGISITLPSNNSKAAAEMYTQDDVTNYEIQITDAFGKTYTKRGAAGETVPFENVSVGKCTVDVWAVDGSDYTAAFGSTVAEVEEDKITEVTVEVSLMAKNNFFLNTPQGAWSRDWENYYRNNQFYSARKDFDFGVEVEDTEIMKEGPDGEVVTIREKTVKNYYAKILNPAFNYSALVFMQKLNFDSVPDPCIKIKMKADNECDILVTLQDYKRESTPVMKTIHVTNEMQEFTLNYASRPEVLGTLPKESVFSIYLTTDCGKVYVESAGFSPRDIPDPGIWDNMTAIPSDRNIVSYEQDTNSGTFTFDQSKARSLGVTKPAAGISGTPKSLESSGLYGITVGLTSLNHGVTGDVFLRDPGTDSGKYSIYANDISLETDDPTNYHFIIPAVKGYDDLTEEYISTLFKTAMDAEIKFDTVSLIIDDYDYGYGTVGFENADDKIAVMSGDPENEQSNPIFLLPGESKDFEIALFATDYSSSSYSESTPAARFHVTDPSQNLSGLSVQTVVADGIKKFRITNTSSTGKTAKVKMTESGLPSVENGSFDTDDYVNFKDKIVRVLQPGDKVLFYSKFYDDDGYKIFEYGADDEGGIIYLEFNGYAQTKLFDKIVVKLYNYKTNQYVTDGPVELDVEWFSAEDRKKFQANVYPTVTTSMDFHDLAIAVELAEPVNTMKIIEIEKAMVRNYH